MNAAQNVVAAARLLRILEIRGRRQEVSGNHAEHLAGRQQQVSAAGGQAGARAALCGSNQMIALFSSWAGPYLLTFAVLALAAFTTLLACYLFL